MDPFQKIDDGRAGRADAGRTDGRGRSDAGELLNDARVAHRERRDRDGGEFSTHFCPKPN